MDRCEYLWSCDCFSAIMYVARCLLSWLLFAAAANYFSYFGVERLVNIIVDNWHDAIVVYLYFCMYNIFSGEFQVWSLCK